MAEFSMPIEKPQAKQNFSAAGKPWEKKSRNEKDLIKNKKANPFKDIGSWRQRVPSSARQMDAQNTKTRENLAALKQKAIPKDKKVSLEEQKRLKFYKVKFFKK